MTVCEKEFVINVKVGGFYVDFEMALWLVENRNWVVINHKDYNYQNPTPCDLLDIGHDYFMPPNDRPEFRSNQDLIDCVREFKRRHENDEYPEKYYGHIHTLRIVKINFGVDIEHVGVGKEQVSGWAYTSED